MIKIIRLIFLLALVLLSACNAYKNLTYLEGIDQTPRDSLYAKHKENYIIQPHDNLYIRIMSGNDETDKYYNLAGGGNQGNMNMMTGGNMYMIGYYVSDTGYIEMPVLGYLKVSGLTLPQVKVLVEKTLSKYLANAFVVVKMPGASYTTLGEFNSTGIHNFEGEELNIIDAIAMAGGISDYGIRDKVVVMRQYPEGIKSHTIDLTRDDILTNADFYIMPNDILYAKPMKYKIFKIRSGDVLTAFSTFTSLISIALLIVTINQIKK